jgi:peroxiredoxin Q/BCP
MRNAPDFTLTDQHEVTHSMKDYRGQWVLIYFYPKDDTPGCTKEACSFRDSFETFKSMGVQVLGVSKDTIKSHKKFAEKFNLNFPLLADETKEVHKAFGAWTERGFMGRPGTLRNSYLVNPQGEIVKEYVKVKPELHVSEIIKDLESFQTQEKA